MLEVMKLVDPGGTPIEIFHAPLIQPSRPFHPGRGMHGRFVTGDGGAGHCILAQPDSDAATRFYQALGMRGGVEYKFGTGPKAVQIRFMHCSPREDSDPDRAREARERPDVLVLLRLAFRVPDRVRLRRSPRDASRSRR